MSSMSINGDGAIALGYNVCNGTSIYPGARITGRASCDSLGIMTAGEINMVDGADHNDSNRYGDYNGMLTDPVDGSFWFTAQYNPGTNWSTSLVHFKISSCLATDVTELTVLDANLKIVPQPAEDLIEVSLNHDVSEKSKMQVLDRSGAVIMEQTISLVSGNNQFQFNVTSLPNGFYILKIPSQKGTLIAKLVVQRG
jgi:hypothetical protein